VAVIKTFVSIVAVSTLAGTGVALAGAGVALAGAGVALAGVTLTVLVSSLQLTLVTKTETERANSIDIAANVFRI
jgi:hypothetical protein